MADYNINEIAGSLALVLGSIGGLCLIMFKSRCESISLFWGCYSCIRKVVEEEHPEPDDEAILPPVAPVIPPVAPPVAPPVVAPVVAP